MYQKMFMDPAEIAKMMQDVKFPEISSMMEAWKFPMPDTHPALAPFSMMTPVDMKALKDIQDRNIAAVTKSMEAAFKGGEDILKFQNVWLGYLLGELQTVSKAINVDATPTDAMKVQSDAAKVTLAAIADALQKMLEITEQTTTASMAPLNERAQAILSEVQALVRDMQLTPAGKTTKAAKVPAAAVKPAAAKPATQTAPKKPAAKPVAKKAPAKKTAPVKAQTKPVAPVVEKAKEPKQQVTPDAAKPVEAAKPANTAAPKKTSAA